MHTVAGKHGNRDDQLMFFPVAFEQSAEVDKHSLMEIWLFIRLRLKMNKYVGVRGNILRFQQKIKRAGLFANDINELLLHKKTGLAVIQQFVEFGEEQRNKFGEKSLQQLF
nr:hypothetical protein [Paenibacillus oralis]